VNAYNLIFRPDDLLKNAGKGLRQGFNDAGPVEGKGKYHG
jgi:riboflavin synthase